MQQPVEAHVVAGGEIESTGISFQDYGAMQQHSPKLFHSRNSTPPWASNLPQCGEVIARYFERRAGIVKPRIDTPERRVIHAHAKILAAIPANVAVLDRLSAEYVAAQTARDDTRARALERQILALDGKLVIDKQGPSTIVGIVHYFLRCGFDSVETAAALNHVMTPMAVRQIAARLAQTWERMQSGADRQPKAAELRKAKQRERWKSSGYAEIQAARQKAKRAAETPEQRAARLSYSRNWYHANRDRVRAQQKANWKRRDKALAAYRAMTPEQIEERRKKARIYEAERREKLNADARRRAAAKAAKMTHEEREIKRAQSRAYAAAHRDRIRELHRAHRARKKAAQAAAQSAATPVGLSVSCASSLSPDLVLQGR